jgi:hypothetical protein
VPRGRAAGVALAVVCGGGIAIAVAASGACVPQNCESTTSTFDFNNEGIQTTTKEGFVLLASGPLAGQWIDYPGGLTITVTLPTGFVAVQPPNVYVSTGANQDAGATSTLISGQVSQVTDISASGFKLNNGSCAEYNVWFSVLGCNAGSACVTTTIDGGVGGAVESGVESDARAE